MSELVIRPTMKFIFMGYVVLILIITAALAVSYKVQWPPSIPPTVQTWLPWLSVLLLLWPLKSHLRNRMTRLTVVGDHLHYETGVLGRTSRSMAVWNVQDVTVRQTIGQRIFGVGDLSIETAGKSSWETIHNIDRPQLAVARINELCSTRPPIDPHA